ncbi:MAG TPA: hypothetical protein VM100_04155 [Longimicrobiales bacterium]|nr:hypothetical protein [Longimicrobiales bacterium]
MLKRYATSLLLVACFAAKLPAQTPSGTEILRRMHDAYAGKWYRTLTFTQKTTQWRPDGTMREAVWYESLRHFDDRGTLLRIDIGTPSTGNGILFSADSSWVMRAGKLAVARPSGNEFLPLIEGVYMQPVDVTAKQLTAMGFDVTKTTSGNWKGTPVWIVGTSSTTDTTSTQFWIDKARNIVLRAFISPAPNTVMDIHLNNYVQVGKGWLATKIEMTVGGKPAQSEEYSDWKVDVELAPELFTPATWSTAPHWVKEVSK